MKRIILSIGMVMLSVLGFSQIFEVSLEDRIAISSNVFEGRVISSTPMWDEGHQNIYTVHTIELSKVFKGGQSVTKQVITPGGVVGLDMEKVDHALSLKVGDYGVFALRNSNKTLPGFTNILESSAGPQSIVVFDKFSQGAYDNFSNYSSIEKDLYSKIETVTGQKVIIVKNIDWKTGISSKTNSPYTKFWFKQGNAGTPKSASITNFVPTTLNAGTGTTITITGSGFGASAGTVSFSDANDGGSSFYDALGTQIVSWNDNQIVVEVPDRAGTGPIQVNGITSASSLTVNYSHINVESDVVSSGSFVAYETQHIDADGSGGYTWQMFTDFAADVDAVASFTRAFDTWRCTGTNINWEIGSNTGTDVIADDGINVIRFDNGTELPNGVLGRCTSRYSGCFVGGSDIEWYVSELDIVFDDGTNWNYDVATPGFTEYDFESVAVHELGHGHQLGHIINTNAVMHYAISNGEDNRDLGVNEELAGGNYVMGKSTSSTVCGNSVMTEYSCGTAPTADFSASATSICAGQSVTFTDASSESPISWSWNFGDGGSSSSQNPSHTYNSAGTYTVTLTATNANGSDDEVKTDLITVNDVPATPGSISGANPGCSLSDETYSITPVSGATSYFWTVMSGTNINSGNGTSSINVTLGNTSGNITVVAQNGCGNSPQQIEIFTINNCSSVPNTGVRVADCGKIVSAFNEKFYASTVSGAVKYQWEFTDPSMNVTTVLTNTKAITLVNAGLNNLGTTYDVRVRAKVGTDWGNYSWVCQITSPGGISNTGVRSADCGLTMGDFLDKFYASYVPGATMYEWEFTDPSMNVTTATNPTKAMSFYWAGLTDINTTYDVRVRAYVNGTPGSYNWVCQLTSPGTAITVSNDPNSLVEKSSIIDEDINNGISLESTVVYPNPFNETLNIDFDGNVEEKTIAIYNSVGQLIKTLVSSDNLVSLELGELNYGIYMMQITSGDELKTIRILKQ